MFSIKEIIVNAEKVQSSAYRMNERISRLRQNIIELNNESEEVQQAINELTEIMKSLTGIDLLVIEALDKDLYKARFGI